MEYDSIDGVIIEIWNEYSSKLLEHGICTELNEVDGNFEIKGREYFVGKVYQALFDEPFNWNCGGCKNNNSRRLKDFINQKLNIEL